MRATRTILLISAFLVVSSCAPKPALISLEATETALIPPPTPTATEAPQYEPGTVVLDPEYSFNGQIEIIEENQEAFYNNFLDSLIRINRDYFKVLKTSQGVEVTDVTTLRTYLEANEWTVPEGLQIPIKPPPTNWLSVETSEPLRNPLSLRYIYISFIDVSAYADATTNGCLDGNILFYPYDDARRGSSIGVGFTVRENEGINTLTMVVAQKADTSFVGFPVDGENLSEAKVDLFNTYLRYILYVTRTMQTNPKSELEIIVSSQGNYGDFALTSKVNKASGVGTINGTGALFRLFTQYDPTDAAPEIIRLK